MTTPSSPSSSPSSSVPVSPAGLLRRIAALVYDLLLLIGLSFGYGALLILIHSFFVEDASAEGSLLYKTVFQAGLLLMIAGFYIYFWRHGGQTLGMRAWRIRLVNENNSPVSLPQCLLRCIYAPISIAAFGLGYLWLLLDKNGQTIPDRWTQTFVVVMPKESKNKAVSKG